MKFEKTPGQHPLRPLAYGGAAVLLALGTASARWVLTSEENWCRGAWFFLTALASWGLLAFCLYQIFHGTRLAVRLTLGGLGAGILLLMLAGTAMLWLWFTAQPVWTWLLPPAGAVLGFCLAVFGVTRRSLAPLQKLKSALQEACDLGPGPQVDLEGADKTEFYELGQMFNQFSSNSHVQLNKLQGEGETCRQLVTGPLLGLMNRQSRAGLEPGLTEPLKGSLLVLMPGGADPEADWLNRMMETITGFRGAAVGYDLSRRTLIAAFEQEREAVDCARACVGVPGAAAVLHQDGKFGFFGGRQSLYPVALIPGIGRRLAALALLRQFGARLLFTGGQGGGLRLLGWDDGQPFYEDTTLRPAHWQADWQKAAPLWTEALALYRARAFGPAMDRLAEILHILPEEEAARWYLFRCHVLCRRPEEERDLDLLWEGGNMP